MSRATIRVLRDLCSLYDPSERFLSIRLELRTETGEQLVSGGGIWDRRKNRWFTPKNLTVLLGPEIAEANQALIGPAHILVVEESQVEYVRAFGLWLRSFALGAPRPAYVDVLAGKRRGGKTWVMVACVILAAVAVPARFHADGHMLAFVGWLVVPSFPEQREMHEDLLAVLEQRRDVGSRETVQVLRSIPEKWWRYRPAPNNFYVFVHGSTVFLKSANRADSLKQGRVDVIGINEGQKVDSEAPVHCAGNTIDGEGLLILAANAPRKARGSWMRELKYAVDDGRAVDPVDGKQVVRWFTIDPAKNKRISQEGRRKYRIFAGIINPKLALADADAEWNEQQDVVFFSYRPELAIKEVPYDWVNVTGEVISTMRLRDWIRPPADYTSFGGVDFNKWPWFAFLGFKAYRVPTRNNLLVYVVEREFRNEQERDRPLTEREVIIQLYNAGWRPEEILWIADPSGQWQSSKNRQKGGVAAGHSSFDLFRSPTEVSLDGEELVIPAWDMFAPTTWKLKDSEHFPHPRKTESIDECNDLFRDSRVFILEDACPHFIKACKKAPLDPHARGVTDDLRDLWHIIDAFRYPIHRAQSAMEPKRKPRGEAARRAAGGLPQRRTGGPSLGSGRRVR